jgi:hypothetical protein
MRLPSLLRRTPFRLTLLFLALFAAAASAILAYVYVASASEAQDPGRARTVRTGETQALTANLRGTRGPDALNREVVDRASRTGGTFLHLGMEPADGAKVRRHAWRDRHGRRLGRRPLEPEHASPIPNYSGGEVWATFRFTDIDPDGRVTRAPGRLRRPDARFQERPACCSSASPWGTPKPIWRRLTQALWTAMGMVLLLGAGGGRAGQPQSRTRHGPAQHRRHRRAGRRPQGPGRWSATPATSWTSSASGLNTGCSTGCKRSMASIRHAGDAIAHDLRSPLTRMRAKLEVALIDAEAGRVDGVDALQLALDEADTLLKTFNTVLAIARLQAAAGRHAGR